MAFTKQEGFSIIVSSQQTRFHIVEADASREIDIKDVNLSVAKVALDSDTMQKKKKERGGNDTIELISAAHVRIKAGRHYALVGRNGTGKSTILRAISEKLIPGMHSDLHIAALQQTLDGSSFDPGGLTEATVIETILHSDPYRNNVRDTIVRIDAALASPDVLAPVRVVRDIQLQRAKAQLFDLQKLAQLRSGARGFNIRKKLRSFEDKITALEARALQQTGDIVSADIDTDTHYALDMQTRLQLEQDGLNPDKYENKAKEVCFGLGFEEPQLHHKFTSLSGGWKMRCLLAATLLHPADLLILDEPTNFLDLLGVMWLERYITDMKSSAPKTAVIIVSHDQEFINNISEELIILQDKSLAYFQGNLQAYDKNVRHETLRLTRMAEAQDRQRAQMERTIAENIREGKKRGDDRRLRQAKSRQLKLDDRMGLQVSAKGTRFKLNRDLLGHHLASRAEIEIPKSQQEVALSLPSAPNLRFPGSLVFVENARLHYRGAPRPILENVNIVVHAGDRLGIVGMNGAGKSTLVKALTGKMQATSGVITHHPRLKIGYYSQHEVDKLSSLTTGNVILTALSVVLQKARDNGLTLAEGEARKLLARIGISGQTAAETPVFRLSGGQLVRVALALLFLDPPHLFVLDEPTTHLDAMTVRALAHGLKAYDGAVVLVTHDRFLLRTVVEGAAAATLDSDEDSTASAEEDRRRLLFEVRAGRLLQKHTGVSGFESDLERKLERMSLQP